MNSNKKIIAAVVGLIFVGGLAYFIYRTKAAGLVGVRPVSESSTQEHSSISSTALSQEEELILKKVISAKENVPVDTISLRYLKISADNHLVKGSVSFKCDYDPEDTEHSGCSGSLYASKTSGTWKYVMGNGFACRDVLDIGVPLEWAESNFSKSACK